MIICITGHFPKYDNSVPTGETEFVVSHGIDSETLQLIPLPNEPPLNLGAKFDPNLNEWVID